jgi:hypothetical protein
MNTLLTTRAGVLLLALGLSSPARSAEIELPRDGWASWQVAAVDSAPAWCCFSWNDRNATPSTCRLDGSREGFGTRQDNATTDAVKVYVRSAGGKVERLQVLSASCPVETDTPIQQLGDVFPDDSARWLSARAKNSGDDAISHWSLGENALAALAVHRGEVARGTIASLARSENTKTRKLAIFWAAIVRGEEGAALASSVMFNDAEPEVRKHGAFAVAQSKSKRVAADLIRLGNTDNVSDVRGQAWFWLAQSGAPEAESAISAALRKDSTDHVRDKAIFALSQLPEERAPRALIAAAEDQSLPREQRKRAVFWLAQSEQASAQSYLDKVLARVNP